ncbi:GGDEF domain-containing protein [Marinospirillum sp.]|uniref:GGDEF domain-containing protein n=1 Tax=Marinospirillum sp. TaxID=2183934 RepID=UPI003A8B3A12
MPHTERRRFSLGLKLRNPWHPRWLPASLRDTLSNRHHSHDFNCARSEYLRSRLVFVASAFFLLVPLWFLVDLLLLPRGYTLELLIGRSLLMLSLALVLYRLIKSRQNLNRVRNLLAATLLLPLIFYAALAWAIGPSLGSLAGYNFIPLLLVAFISVFPLTLIEGFGIGFAVCLLEAFVLYHLGQLGSIAGLQEIWLLGTVLCISLWANHSQVSALMRLYRQASMDSLTGLLNRGVLLEQLDHLQAQRQEALEEGRTATPVCLLMFDLDRFKKINDTYGHSIGDHVLQEFAAILRSEVRKSDLVARYGGEEFMAVLPGANKEAATQIAERILKGCSHADIHAHDGQTVHFTTSIGITQLRDQESLDSALQRVDQRLYAAKHQGRNCFIDAD